MGLEFVSLQASEEQDLVRFLLQSFQPETTPNSFRSEVMRWKYFVDHPQWKGPRSLALKEKGQIVAHGGVWPVSLLSSKGEIKGIHVIDWAASRSSVGAGVHLLRKMSGLADMLMTIGGSEDTRALLPKLGYKRCGEVRRYARVVRPWLHFRTTAQKNWKTPFKLLGHSVSALAEIPPVPAGWHASKIASFTGSMVSACFHQTTGSTAPRRTAAGLNYLLSCPGANFSGFLVTQAEKPIGYFLLAQLGRQARIVDLRIDRKDGKSWQSVCALAAGTAAEDPETCEIVAASSNEATGNVWLQTGFTTRRTDRIFCFDPQNLAGSRPQFDLTLADGDMCFLSQPGSPYLS